MSDKEYRLEDTKVEENIREGNPNLEHEIRRNERLRRKERLYNIMIIGPPISIGLLLVANYYLKNNYNINAISKYLSGLQFVIIGLLLLFVFAILLRYLQYGSIFPVSHPLNLYMENLSDETKEKAETELDKIFKKIKSEVDEAKGCEKIMASLDVESTVPGYRSIAPLTIMRLNKEINALGLRGNINLALGILITMTGLVLLYSYVSNISINDGNPVKMVGYFLPRFSMVILIEIFAYFFLKLYKGCLYEIKYFQNELTNIECKIVALIASINNNNAELTSNVILELSKTERNFILQKGQTTVEIERSKLDKEALLGALKALPQMVAGKFE